MSTEYNYMYNERSSTDLLSCDSCEYTAPLSHFPELAGRPARNLCEICASTEIGSIMAYGRQYQNAHLCKVMAQVGNVILDKTTGRSPDKEGS